MITFSLFVTIFVIFRLVFKNKISTILFDFIGTALHELSHFTVGLFLMAQPVKFSLFPKFEDNQVILGHVTFRNIQFFNALPIGLSPLLLIVPAIYILSFVYYSQVSIFESFALSFLFTSIIFGIPPSSADYRIALSSWLGILFYLILIFAIIIYYFPEIQVIQYLRGFYENSIINN